MHPVPFVIIFDRDNSLPRKLVTTLDSGGFHCHTVEQLQEIPEVLKELKMAFLVINAGSEPKKASALFNEVTDNPDISDYPTVFIARNSKSLQRGLYQFFLSARIIEAPSTVPDIIGAIGGLEGEYPDYLTQLKIIAPKRLPQKPLVAPEKRPTGDTNLLGSVTLEEEETLELVSAYTTKENTSERKPDFTPSSESEREPIVISADSPFYALLSAETASRACGQSSDFVDAASIAHYLMKSALSDGSALSAAINYLRADQAPTRNDIARILRTETENDYDEEEACSRAVIRRVAELLEGLEEVPQDDITLCATTVLLSDITTRLCVNLDGTFEPRSAYHILRRLRSGELAHLHPTACDCFLKTLTSLLDSQGQEKEQGQEISEPVSQKEAHGGEKAIALNDFAPGMQLSRGVWSKCGKEILEADTVLDDDLIMRVWQLATVLTLHSPFYIRDQGEAGAQA